MAKRVEELLLEAYHGDLERKRAVRRDSPAISDKWLAKVLVSENHRRRGENVRREAVGSITPIGGHVDQGALADAQLTSTSVHTLDYLTFSELR